MNRQTPVAQRTSQLPSSYRQSPSSNPNPMYYATAGAQTTSQQQPSSRGASTGQLPAGFPSVGVARGGPGPPGFSSRTAGDTSEFPALGGGSSYASQAQQSAMFMSQPQGPLSGGIQPPGPPPGISAPGTAGGQGQGQTNGLRDENSRGNGEEFPALGGMNGAGAVSSEAKDRIPNFLRNHGQHAQAPPSPPSTLPNGASGSHTNSVAPPNTIQQHLAQSMPTGGDMSWLRQSPSRGLEQITRPVQQILSSPVDKWGLQALLYEIKMGKGDRAMLMFGEDLSQLGVDLEQPNLLYPTFVTPWLDSSQTSHQGPIEDIFDIPAHYTSFNAPAISPKLHSFEDNTLFYIFYSAPEDLSQLEAADELYKRGWRYHIPSQIWIGGSTLTGFDPRENPPTPETPWIRGPVIIFDYNKFEQAALTDQSLNPYDFEPTRTIAQALHEQQSQAEEEKRSQGQGHRDLKSPMSNDPHHIPTGRATASTISSRA